MAEQVYYSSAWNGKPKTAGTAQLLKGQCQKVSIEHHKCFDSMQFKVVVCVKKKKRMGYKYYKTPVYTQNKPEN